MRVLLGGVPFGRNNVGDEAILEGVVGLVRELCPDASLTVSTADPATAQKLNVAVTPLMGFDEQDATRVQRTFAEQDVFVWSGATGLSDYPEVATFVLEQAQRAGCRTLLLGVGMNRELNPALYRVRPGRRREVLSLVNRLTGHRIDAIKLEEWRRRRRALQRVARYLHSADLVVVRDPESLAELRRAGVTREVIVGADCALRVAPTPFESVRLADPVRHALGSTDIKVGLCISTQGQVVQASGEYRFSDVDAWATFVDRLTQDLRTRVVFIPMNPLTDATLARAIRGKLQRPELVEVIEGQLEPGDVVAISARLDAVISSRLHLLILSSINNVPLVGISNGTKVDNHLRAYGLHPATLADAVDFERLHDETRRMLADRSAFKLRAESVRQAALARIEAVKPRLARGLSMPRGAS